jgi:glycosyltransferase involved in cell wall biosynthesis
VRVPLSNRHPSCSRNHLVRGRRRDRQRLLAEHMHAALRGIEREERVQRKDEFLGNAYALLLPIDWPEPFGLVMIKAMACGMPVIAYCHGSIPEVIEDGGYGVYC